MVDCECLANCPFFFDKMDNMPAMTDMYKRKYCKGDNTDCARHMVFEAYGSGMVPTDLFPNDIARAQEILRG